MRNKSEFRTIVLCYHNLIASLPRMYVISKNKEMLSGRSILVFCEYLSIQIDRTIKLPSISQQILSKRHHEDILSNVNFLNISNHRSCQDSEQVRNIINFLSFSIKRQSLPDYLEVINKAVSSILLSYLRILKKSETS